MWRRSGNMEKQLLPDTHTVVDVGKFSWSRRTPGRDHYYNKMNHDNMNI